MKKALKILLFGIIIWAIPYFAGYFFYSKEGQLLIDLFLFKTIMILLGNFIGISFIVLYLLKVKTNYLKESLLIGFIWLIINYILDFLLLLPIMKISIPEYFSQIGLRYLLMPMISLACGYLMKKTRIYIQ